MARWVSYCPQLYNKCFPSQNRTINDQYLGNVKLIGLFNIQLTEKYKNWQVESTKALDFVNKKSIKVDTMKHFQYGLTTCENT